MSGAVFLALIGLAQQLKKVAALIEQQAGAGGPITVTPGEITLPGIIPVQITPEASEPLLKLPTYYTTDEQEYQEVLKYTVPSNYKVYLQELSIAPDTAAKTKAQFMIHVGAAKVEDIRIQASLTLPWGWLYFGEGTTIGVWIKSTDGTTVGANVSLNGRRIKIR